MIMGSVFGLLAVNATKPSAVSYLNEAETR